jgi:hypothetical protein
MSAPIEIRLTRDEALVLFEFFWRFQEQDRLRLMNNAEFIALSAISAQLDKALTEPLDDDYDQKLYDAQSRVAAGYEGIAPGVESS